MPEAVSEEGWSTVSRLPLDEQLTALGAALALNKTLVEVLDRVAELAVPRWYLTAGCLFQTVWNVVTGRPTTHGIRDYDLFYFDSEGLSWDAEDRVIRAGAALFADLPANVEIRNEARVHLWYQEKFGAPAPRIRVSSRRSTPSRRPPAASPSARRPTAAGGSTPRTGCPTSSAFGCVPTRFWHPARSTGPRPNAGRGCGPNSPCSPGPPTEPEGEPLWNAQVPEHPTHV
ncbi:nucleotidyltransferase family protein [Nocardiopsis oceani]